MLIILSCFPTTFRVHAQENRTVLTIGECVNTGLENSASLHASLMQNKETRARLSEAYTMYFPTVSSSFVYSRLSETDPFTITIPIPGNPISQEITSPVTDSFSFNLSLKQPVFTGFRILNNTEKAVLALEASTAAFINARNELVYTIKKDYWTLVKAVEMKKLADENLRVVDAYFKDSQNLFNQGLATNNDILKSQIHLSKAELAQIDAENKVKLAQLKLSLSMGMDNAGVMYPAPPEYSATRLPAGTEDLVENAIKARPEQAVLRAHIDSSRKDIDLSYAAWYPSIFLTGNFSFARPNQRYFPPEDEFKFSWDIGVYAIIDANAWYSAPFKTEQAAARLSALRDSETQLKQAINMEVTRAWLEAGKLSKQIDVAGIMLNQAGENEKIVTHSFGNGVALRSELLEAQLRKNQALLELTAARIDYEIALLDLEKAAGFDPLEERITG